MKDPIRPGGDSGCGHACGEKEEGGRESIHGEDDERIHVSLGKLSVDRSAAGLPPFRLLGGVVVRCQYRQSCGELSIYHMPAFSPLLSTPMRRPGLSAPAVFNRWHHDQDLYRHKVYALDHLAFGTALRNLIAGRVSGS